MILMIIMIEFLRRLTTLTTERYLHDTQVVFNENLTHTDRLLNTLRI